jgi:hypothetical protein
MILFNISMRVGRLFPHYIFICVPQCFLYGIAKMFFFYKNKVRRTVSVIVFPENDVQCFACPRYWQKMKSSVVFIKYFHVLITGICFIFVSPLMLWVRISLRRVVFVTTLCDKAYQWLATGWWVSPGFSTNKSDCHHITEILLKVALSIITLTLTHIRTFRY